MQTFTALIVDDEIRGAQSLQKMLAHSHPDVEVTGLAHSGTDGIAAIKSASPDLVFLDIQLMDMSGFDVLEALPGGAFAVIFTTAYDDYALKAFRYSAIDYLLKPIDMDELKEALEKFRRGKAAPPSSTGAAQLENLLHQFKSKSLSRIALPTQDGLLFVKLEDVIRLQASSNYTTFHLAGRKPIIVSKTMGDFEELLQGQPFIRVHNSHMINMNHVDKYIKGEGGTVIMSDKTELEVSRRKKEEFLKRLEETMVRNR